MVRPALFLFMLAEEFTRPFLPRYVQALAPADLPFSTDVAISLPIVAFMAGVALCQLPFAAASEWLGRRNGFVMGAALAACGYALSGFTGSYYLFLAARVLSAIGYALGRWLALPSLQLQIVVMFCALPTASSAYVLAARMGGNGPFVAFLISAGTLLSLATLPLWLSLVRSV